MMRVAVGIMAALILSAFSQPASADGRKNGTMHLMPSKEWAKTVPDEKLGKMRGGFVGVQWSLEFVATVVNTQADVTSNIPGASGSLPDGSTATLSNGNLQVSTLVALGAGGSFNGIGIVNVIPGNFNVVDFQLNMNINIINVTNAATIPTSVTFLSGN